MSPDVVTEIALLALLAATASAVILLRNLVGVVMLTGIYSLLTAALFADLGAVDVAFTEAAVGAGISTVLMLLALALVGAHERRRERRRPLLPLLVTLVTAGALLYGVTDFPPVGDPGSAPNTHVAPYYLAETGTEIGVPNVVTAVLASYRGFDTLGETVVIFTAAVSVFLLLGVPRRRRGGQEREYLVLRVVTKLLLPPILLFALYVQFHGDFGAGGGFQAGVIFAAGIVLYALIFDYDLALRVVSRRALAVLIPLGVLLYGGVGVATLALGGSFLDYDVLSHDPVHGQHLGILLVEFGVGLTVASVMAGIFLGFFQHWRRDA